MSMTNYCIVCDRNIGRTGTGALYCGVGGCDTLKQEREREYNAKDKAGETRTQTDHLPLFHQDKEAGAFCPPLGYSGGGAWW